MAEMLKQKLKEKIEAFRPRTTEAQQGVRQDRDRQGQYRPVHRRRARHPLPRDRHLLPRSPGRHPLPRQDDPGDVRGAAQGRRAPRSRPSSRFFYFLLTGEIPTMEQALEVVAGLEGPRRRCPSTCSTCSARCRATPTRWRCSRPAIIAMQRESKFAKQLRDRDDQEERHVGADVRGRDGHRRAAPVHRRLHLPHEVQGRHADRRRTRSSTWGGNFAHMIGHA